jgi:CheY-like chemotaxis protein
VEDQQRIGLFIKQALIERSYVATWVRTCREASDALCESNPDAIILDLGLPDGDGLKLLQQWRRSGFGLGLAICRSIVNLHGGKMWAEAAPDSTGLRVVFTVPTTT